MKILKASDLAYALRHIADCIAAGDSFEGTLEYTCLAEGLDSHEFEVKAAIRTGNSDGQGGMLIL